MVRLNDRLARCKPRSIAFAAAFASLNMAFCSGFAANAQLNPEMVLRTGHAGLPQQIALSPQGRLVASWSEDGTLIVWDTDSLQEYTRVLAKYPGAVPKFVLSERELLMNDQSGIASYTLTRHPVKHLVVPGTITDFAVSNDGNLIAYLNDDRAIWLFNRTSAASIKVQDQSLEEFYVALAFNADSSRLAVVRPSGAATIYALQPQHELPLCYTATAIHPAAIGFDAAGLLWVFGRIDGQEFATSAVEAARLRFQDNPTCIQERSVITLDEPIGNMAFSGSAKILTALTYSGGSGTAMSKPVGGDLKVTTLSGPPMSPGIFVSAPPPLAIAQSGSKAAAIDFRGQISTWDLAKDSVNTIPRGEVEPAGSLDFSPASSLLIISRSGVPDIWDIAAGEQLSPPQNARGPLAAAARHNWIAFFSRAQKLIFLNPRTGVSSQPGLSISGHPENIWLVDDDKKVLWTERSSAHSPITLRIWDVANKTEPRVVCHQQDFRPPVAVSKSTHRFAAVCSSGEKEPPYEIIRHGVYVWSLPNLKPMLIDRKDERTATMTFSPDDTSILLGGSDLERVDLTTGVHFRWEGSEVRRGADAMAFSADGKTAYVASGYELAVWKNLNSSQRARNVIKSGPPTINSISIAANGNLWVGSEDGTVVLRSATAGTPLITLASIIQAGWIAAAPDGFFDGDADAIRWIGWRKDPASNLTDADTFFDSFYYPGLLATVAAGQRPKRRGRTLGDQLNLPGLDYLIDVHLASVIEQGGFGLCLPDRPTPQLLAQVELSYRGRAGNLNALKYERRDVPECKFFTPLPGDLRDYEINSRATHSNMKAVNPSADEATPSPGHGVTVHFQAIAFDDYHSFRALSYSAADGKAIGDFFQTQAFSAEEKGGPHVRIWPPLLDGTSVKDIRTRVEAIGSTATPQDLVVLFFSGHGTVLPGQQMYFFLPNTISSKDALAIRADSIDTAMFADFLRHIQADRILLIVDSCQSGGALDSLRRIADVKTSPVRSPLLSSVGSRGVAIISAATPFEEAAQQSTLGASFLTKALLDALQSDAWSISDLSKVLNTHIQKILPDGFQQTAEVLLSGHDFEVRTQKR